LSEASPPAGVVSHWTREKWREGGAEVALDEI